MIEQNANFEDRVKAWWNVLSPEQRAGALSVKDDAFLSTLIHFASLSSSSAQVGTGLNAETDGGGCSCDTLANCKWSKEFLISDIEHTFSGYCRRLGGTMDASFSKQNNLHPLSSLSQVDKMVTTDVNLDVTKFENNRSSFPPLSSRQLSKASHVVVGESQTEKIQKATLGSDAFSIQKEQGIIITAKASDTEAYAEKNPEAPHGAVEASPVETIVKQLQFIFPSVIAAAQEHGLSFSLDYSHEHGDSLPVLSLAPSAAQNFDPDCLPLEGMIGSGSFSWIKALRNYVEHETLSGRKLTASLSLMILSRIRVSLTDAFLSSEADAIPSVIFKTANVDQAQSRLDRHSPSRDAGAVDKNEKEDQDALALIGPATRPATRVPHKSRNGISFENDVANNGNTEESTLDAQPTPSIFILSEIVEKVAVESDYDELRSVPVGFLPFIPLEIVLRWNIEEIKRIDPCLKKLLTSVLPRAVKVGCLPYKLLEAENITGEYDIDATARHETDADSLNFQDSQQSLLAKKKKKKKKKKRKTSNADLMPGKELPLVDLTTSIAPNGAASESATKLPSQTDGTAAIERVEVPQVHLDGSVETAPTGQPSRHSISIPEITSPSSLVSDYELTSVRILRPDAIGPTFVTVPVSEPEPVNADHNDEPSIPEAPDEVDDDDEWETVEAKGKGKNRVKPSESRMRSHHSQNWSSSWRTGSGNSRKVKAGRTSASRKRNATRRIVRDVLTSVLDSVDVEVRRRKSAMEAKVLEERRNRLTHNGHQVVGPAATGRGQAASMTMRDVIVANQRNIATTGGNAQPSAAEATHRSVSPNVTGFRESVGESTKMYSSTLLRSKGTQTVGTGAADQSTALTLPDTLSGTSANTQSSLATEEIDNIPERSRVAGSAVVADDSSSVVAGGDEAELSNMKDLACTKDDSSPPLSTLLGPGNSNSATSSVASSLEAPHVSKHRHHHHSSGYNENDVGYHLLDVCDRLSRDMSVFMSRRSLALSARRKERGALLAALQDTVCKIWSNRGKVEMYGSCATQLDLPSSDLDAVILGLGGPHDANSNRPKVSLKKQQRQNTTEFETTRRSMANQTRNQFSHIQTGLMHPHVRLSFNGERVMVLAAELERQPWAVKVKAIPTASVPVVKVLADPSKLPGAINSVASSGNWTIQQHHMAADTGGLAAQASRVAPLPQGQSPYPPWRGADVMNGLFSIDITFDGPEHGGIGSTKYSAEAVQDACKETGLPPEKTPLVQVLMVLKELLAQRRLNEPFSGGLGSYALLLLVNAVVKERAIIRAEMERIERHRELVADDTALITNDFEKVGERLNRDKYQPNKGARASSKRKTNANGVNSQKPSKIESNQRMLPENLNDKPSMAAMSLVEPSGESTPPHVVLGSSWASIAKKSATNQSKQLYAHDHPHTATKAMVRSGPHVPPSFAEAVSRKQLPSQIQTSHKPHITGMNGDPSVHALPDCHPGSIESIPGECIEAFCDAQPDPSNLRSVDEPTQTRSPAKAQSTHSQGPLSQNASPQVLPKQTKGGVVHQNNSNSFVPLDTSLSNAPSLFPQGSDDVLEVLCSGETSAGKLLMHFLLYYGEHFDSRALAIDVVGNFHPDYRDDARPASGHLSPFIPRLSGGTIDPVTGMLTVDPIVIYDPWEGGRGSNVARSCYAWSSIQWHLAQCYMTLSSAVERCGTSLTTPSLVTEDPRKEAILESCRIDNQQRAINGDVISETGPPPQVDTVSPLLELLLSF